MPVYMCIRIEILSAYPDLVWVAGYGCENGGIGATEHDMSYETRWFDITKTCCNLAVMVGPK